MANHAIVIGINAYSNPDWNLSAAVQDALSFAEWTLKHGGVTEENLRLLLSASQPNATPLRYEAANSQNIIDAIQSFQDAAHPKSGDRLYFYYAGHGLSAPGAKSGGPAEPVLIPADVKDIKSNYKLLIGFSEIIPPLVGAQPGEQFFFIDACRDFGLEDFERAVGSVGAWRPGNSGAGASTRQYWWYATSPGGRAAESQGIKGKGIFAAALMAALNGEEAGLPAMEMSEDGDEYLVRPEKLLSYLQRRIEREIKAADAKRWEEFLQVPQYGLREGSPPNPVLMRFNAEQFSDLDVLVRVQKSVVRQKCQVQVVLKAGRREFVLGSSGPPLPLPAKFSLSPRRYTLQVKAEGYQTRREAFDLYEHRTLEYPTLEPVTSPQPAHRGNGEAEPETEEDFGLESSGPLDEIPSEGELRVEYRDRTGQIVIRDSTNRIVLTGFAGEDKDLVASLPPGYYRLAVRLPEGAVSERLVDIVAGTTTKERLHPPELRMGQAQAAMLAAKGINQTADGYLDAAEYLPRVAGAGLASILGFAASAAHWAGTRLQGLGIQALEPAKGKAGLLVLVGASGDEPAPDYTGKKFLSDARLLARRGDGKLAGDGGFSVLAGFPAAAQLGVEVEAGPVNVRLDLPGSASTSYALACLPDRVAVLIAVADDSGGYEVQQYSLPGWSGATPKGMEYLRQQPVNIRTLEMAQRYYAAGQEVLPSGSEMRGLLDGKWLDPLLGCLAGYSLVKAGRGAEYVGQPDPTAPPTEAEPSAMRNMLKFFPDLPDSHVLAGLSEPERRAEHFANALAHGLPVFAEGTRALIEWYAAQGKELPPQLASASRGLVPGSPWTAWAVSRPALIIQKGSFGRPPRGWEDLEAHRAEIEKAIRSVGRIEMEGGFYSFDGFIGTGWVIADGVLATTGHVGDLFAEKHSRGFRFRANPDGAPYRARVDFREEHSGQEPFEVAIEEILFVPEDNERSASLALFRLAAHASLPPPLPLAGDAAHILRGRRVYTIGYPARDLRGGQEAAARVFGEIYDVKRLQPGEILASSESWYFEHDCFTRGGNAGGPVIDLETGLVLGLHTGGLWIEDQDGGSKRNTAVALWKLKGSVLAQINATYG